jgi:amino acid adenylation domain-containing protein
MNGMQSSPSMGEVQIEGFPLSPQQRRIWSLMRLDGSKAYDAQLTVRAEGPLDVRAFRLAVEDLFERHEILRTSFRGLEELSTPLQVVSERVETPFLFQDLVAVDEPRRNEALVQLQQTMSEPWDFSRSPLARVRLAALEKDHHLLWFAAPAVCADATGLANLMEILAGYYETRVRGASPDDEPLQYPDASAWLNEVLQSEDTATGWNFWRQHDLSSLRDVPLPFERPSGSEPFAPHRLPLTLPASGRLLPSLLLLSLQWLVSRVTGETRALVSKSYAFRDYPGLQNALGVFSRFVPLTGEFPGTLRVEEARRRMELAVAHSEKWGICFDESRLDLASRGLAASRTPFGFEVLERPDPWTGGGVRFVLEERRAVCDRSKLKLIHETSQDGAIAFLEYDSAIFREPDLRRFAGELELLISEMHGHPDARLDELAILPEAERRNLLEEIHTTSAEPSRDRCVHEEILSRARELPHRVAVMSGEQTLTYEALDRESNRLARRLMAMGIGPECAVGFRLERSPRAIAVMMGILKAGGAYVPIDPKLPRARAEKMLLASKARALVSAEGLVEDLPLGELPVLLLDRDAAAIAAESDDPVARGVAPEKLAYVLFTSGSTGEPKAVAIEHRQLASYTRAVLERLDVPAGAVFASVTTLSADLGNTAIFPALTTGGTLHLVPEDVVADPEAFAEYRLRHRVEVLKIVPSHLAMLLTASRPANVLPGKLLVLGGERCSRELLERVRNLAPELAILNHYGPTETTVGATTFRVPADLAAVEGGSVPIGRPLANVRAYVLDEHGAPVPTWVPGELHIGGANVARGYLNGTPSDQGKFCADPFSASPGARMYRTGDRVRFLPGGDLEFLGRADDQVKLRGYRVELGEVQAALRRHPLVSEAAVAVHEGEDGESRLAGYAVIRKGSGQSADGQELRSFLKSELPEFMVPSVIVVLDRLPLNRNGKLDRSALPPLREASAGDARVASEPMDEWETLVKDVWRSLLQLDDVSGDDNFYDLGGHSLLAIRVVSEVEKRTGVHVSPRELVFHTLRQFAAVCRSKGNGKAAG